MNKTVFPLAYFNAKANEDKTNILSAGLDMKYKIIKKTRLWKP